MLADVLRDLRLRDPGVHNQPPEFHIAAMAAARSRAARPGLRR